MFSGLGMVVLPPGSSTGLSAGSGNSLSPSTIWDSVWQGTSDAFFSDSSLSVKRTQRDFPIAPDSG